MILLVLRLKRWKCRPESKAVGIECVIARDRGVVGHGLHIFAILPEGFLHSESVDLGANLAYLTIELNQVGHVVALDLPRYAF